MTGFPSPFGGGDGALFDDYDQFDPGHLLEPGPFLEGRDVLTDEAHVRSTRPRETSSRSGRCTT